LNLTAPKESFGQSALSARKERKAIRLQPFAFFAQYFFVDFAVSNFSNRANTQTPLSQHHNFFSSTFDS
jgi:hypothetical protein